MSFMFLFLISFRVLQAIFYNRSRIPQLSITSSAIPLLWFITSCLLPIMVPQQVFQNPPSSSYRLFSTKPFRVIILSWDVLSFLWKNGQWLQTFILPYKGLYFMNPFISLILSTNLHFCSMYSSHGGLLTVPQTLKTHSCHGTFDKLFTLFGTLFTR